MLPKYFLAEKLSLISIYTRFLRFSLSFKVNLISRMTGMDPLSLSLACLGAVGTISQLLVQVSGFVSDVRDARKDMEAVSRELTSLTICLASLKDDSERVNFPETLLDVVRSCDTIAKEMADVLSKLSNAKMARVRWTLGDRDQINRYKSSLESHKLCIDIALDMAS